IISGMSSSETNDSTTGKSIIPLLRNGTGNGFSNVYSGGGTTYRTDATCGLTCAGNPYIFTSAFRIDSATNTIISELRGNGAIQATRTDLSPPGSPYTFDINQFYIGGRR